MRKINFGLGCAIGFLAGSRAGRAPYDRAMAAAGPLARRAWRACTGQHPILVDLTVTDNGTRNAASSQVGKGT